MRLHPRTLPVQRAGTALEAAVWQVAEEHDLTYVELVRALNGIANRALTYLLREERHPDDPDRKADEE